MIKVGITGQTGFVGTHLYNQLNLLKEEFQTISFNDEYFQNEMLLNDWVGKCDVIVHLAAMNRHEDPQMIYNINISLIDKLLAGMKATASKAHLLFSSSTQEEQDNLYGKSKKDGRELLSNFSKSNNSLFSGLVIPNVYGPFGNPFYNSFIATFCHLLTHEGQPEVKVDGNVKLIYVGNLCDFIINRIRKCSKGEAESKDKIFIPHDFESKVTEVLSKLEYYKKLYLEKGIIPELKNKNEVNLFNTFRSYMDHQKRYPYILTKHTDPRGSFIETMHLEVGGQVSFSTTVPGITRGNHYHTRKIERFTVIKGKALIQLRKIGTDEVLNFELDGKNPSYVDMPIWYTHNIINIGEENLYTIFWINEFYDESDPDTFFEEVELKKE